MQEAAVINFFFEEGRETIGLTSVLHRETKSTTKRNGDTLMVPAIVRGHS